MRQSDASMESRSPGVRRHALKIVAALVVAAGLLLFPWPREWEIAEGDGTRSCVVSRGQARSEVVTTCGKAGRTGGQAKVVDGWTTFCSAPCELRGHHLLFYDCKTNLARVEIITNEYQGCLLEPNSSPSRPASD
jgi:hypothetical protein